MFLSKFQKGLIKENYPQKDNSQCNPFKLSLCYIHTQKIPWGINRARVSKAKYFNPFNCERLNLLSNADLSQAAWNCYVTISQLLCKHILSFRNRLIKFSLFPPHMTLVMSPVALYLKKMASILLMPGKGIAIH